MMFEPGKDQCKKLVFQPAERNKQPILETLLKHIDPNSQGLFLEISSGSGQHVVHISEKFPNIRFQPTDVENIYIRSIKAHIEDGCLKNVLDPLRLDVSEPPESWGEGTMRAASFDYVLNVNLTHVSPWICTEGLFRGCHVYLKPKGLLFTYGPFAMNGIISPQSNVDFDKQLKIRDPTWGLRDIEVELKPLASRFDFELVQIHDLPANNKLLVWQKK
ncbi:unnamed protein product [Nesidiocoris tenuis]|uniref:Methyltransferase type 12 domain-containing protein n=1 Tax=Nesidiocoris tenuis TaxID=355587 RepID=A0A6H5GLR4_9HEMI|nr:unnamed protein product [Nesidiocoris tenuis]